MKLRLLGARPKNPRDKLRSQLYGSRVAAGRRAASSCFKGFPWTAATECRENKRRTLTKWEIQPHQSISLVPKGQQRLFRPSATLSACPAFCFRFHRGPRARRNGQRTLHPRVFVFCFGGRGLKASERGPNTSTRSTYKYKRTAPLTSPLTTR